MEQPTVIFNPKCAALDKVSARSTCSGCGSSRKYFCYKCCVPMPDVKNVMPLVDLPVQVDIIKHPLEVGGKSTAIHAVILAPTYVQLFEYPNIPDYSAHQDETVLLYPDADATSVADICGKLRSISRGDSDVANCPRLKRLVILDGTWFQVKPMRRDPRLEGIQCVRLTTYSSNFWRPHKKAKDSLSTIEALYYFMKEYSLLMNFKQSDLRNLLFFFEYFHKLIFEKDLVIS